MTRLLVATDSYAPRWDGIARFLKEVLPALRERFEVRVIAASHGNYSEENLVTVPVSRLRAGDFRMPKFAPFTIFRALKGVDVVFSQTIGPVGGFTVLFARLRGIPVIAYIHSVEPDLAAKAVNSPFAKQYARAFMIHLTRFVYNRCQLLLVPSEGTRELLDVHGIRAPKAVVQLGVDTDRFHPGRSETLRTSLGFKPDEFVIGYHGRLSREKDLFTLVRAYQRLLHGGVKVRLLIVGDGLPSIRAKLVAAGAVCTGAQEDVVPYLQAMDAYVLSSLTETTSLSTLEAMACSLPVVATAVGFVAEYVRDGRNGFLIKPRDSYHLSLRLKELHADVKLRRSLGENARATVVKGWNWKVTAQRVAEEIEGVVNSRKMS
jgi:glycosyltransferase involved in cell wall biosynthesis